MEINDQATLQQYIDNTPDTYLMPLLAALYLAENDTRSAIELCRQDLTIHPYSSIAHFIWALAAEANDDIEQTVAHLKSAIEADAYFLQAYYKLIELSQGYLTPQQLKQCYEQVCRLNPFDVDIAAKLAALPADLDLLAAQMKIKPQRPPKAKLNEMPEPEPEQTKTLNAAIPDVPEAKRIPEERIIEVEPVQGAAHLSKFFDSLKQATELANQPPAPAEPHIPEEEAHLGPVDLPEPIAEPENEPQVNFDEPETAAPSQEVFSESESGSSIKNLFSRLREKPLEEVQKENWMAEHAMAAIPEEPPTLPQTPEIVVEPEKTAQPRPEPADLLANKLADLVTAKPEVIEEISGPEEPATKEVPVEPVEKKEPPTENTAVEAKSEPEPSKTTPQKRSSRSSKKAEGATNNLSFPIPTWTLVDVLTKQKLFEQALSILDIIEAKSKNEKDLTKVQTSRAEIVKMMAQEQAGEA